MGAKQHRSELERKRRQRMEAEEKAGKARNRETDARSAAAKARARAEKSKSASVKATKVRQAERYEKTAEAAGKEAGRWQARASEKAKGEQRAQVNVAKAERAEAASEELRRARERHRAARVAATESAELRRRLEVNETLMQGALRQMREPRSERLRVLMLGAASAGDLRVGREQSRIRVAVERALHRDLIELDPRPAATTADLLDGITRFRPHVVHFSGHSDDDLIEFEKDVDRRHRGVVVTAQAFARAVAATDDPPLLVLLNSCNSARQLPGLVPQIVPFAIGMADEIADGDAITYAAQFYAAVANGQSILASHSSGQAALELNGLPSADLPVLRCADDVDPAATKLIKPVAA